MELKISKVLSAAVRAAGCLGGALLLANCGGVQSRVHDGVVEETIDQKPTKGKYFTVIGIRASDPALKTDTQRKALARDAAIVKAQYEMLSMIKGVTLEGGIKVERAIEADSTLETRIKEVIKGAEVVKSEFTHDNGCVVTLRLPKARVDGLMRDLVE